MTEKLSRDFSKAIFRSFRLWAFIALDSLCQLIPVRRKNVAVVIRLDAVGDFFIWLQSGAADIAEYARHSGRRSVIVANHAWSDYARLLGLWDEVVDLNPERFMRSPLYRLRVIWKVRKLGAQLLIQPRAARVFLQEDELARTSGAAVRVGNAGTMVNTTSLFQRIGDASYDELIGVNQARDVHETRRNDDFVKGLTGKPSTPFPLNRIHTVSTDKGVAIALGAGQIGRVWPMEKFAELIEYMSNSRSSWPVVVLGAPADTRLAARVQEMVGCPVQNMVGKTTLNEFVDVIAAANLVICNDSSAFHIAMALQKRVVCFLGGGHFGWFAPYPKDHPSSSMARVLSVPMECFWCNWECKYPRGMGGAYRCVDSIPLQAAIDSIESLLAFQSENAPDRQWS